jgi:hypothetical protein
MDLEKAARTAGASGQSFHDWVMSDEVQDVIAAADSFSDADQKAIEKAFGEGRREIAIKKGRLVWTTAPGDYDGADATELEVVGDYFGKPLRKIAIDPEGYGWQTGRYASGTYGVWDNDPIEEDRQAHERHAKAEAERKAVEAKRQAGVVWLRGATASQLKDEDLCWEHGARYEDIRAERTRRHEEEKESTRASSIAAIEKLIPEGATLIDEGEYIVSPLVGLRPIQRPAKVYFDVKLVHGWPDDAEHAKVEHGPGKRKETIPAQPLADLIAKGKVRIAKKGEVPPGPVVDRIGMDRWKDIRRVEVDGKTVWIGRATFGSEDLVLDENGKLVRAKKILEAAKASHGHAWAGPRTRARRKSSKRPRVRRARALKGRYGRPGGWAGESERHSVAARKGWLRRR